MPHQRSGVTCERLARDLERPRPAARLREPHRVEQDAPVLAHVLPRLLEDGHRALPGEIARDGEVTRVGVGPRVRCRVADDAHLVERLEHLDPDGTDRRVHPVLEHLRRAHDVLHVASAHAHERVGDAEVRVLPEPHHHEQLVAGRMHVEVVAVVEVAVARADVADGLRDLVHRVVVPGRERRLRARIHVTSPPAVMSGSSR